MQEAVYFVVEIMMVAGYLMVKGHVYGREQSSRMGCGLKYDV